TPTEFSDDGYCALQENLGSDLYVVIKGAWTAKPHAEKKSLTELIEEDVDLLFPFDARGKAKLTFKNLKTMLKGGIESFCTNQLCRSVVGKQEIQITDAMIQSHVLASFFSYNTSPAISVWDISYVVRGGEGSRDYSVGSVGVCDSMRGAVIQNIQ